MRFPFSRTTTAEVGDEPPHAEPEKGVVQDDRPGDGGGDDGGVDSDAVSLDAQAGVQDIEATTKVWTWSHVVAAYLLIWAIYFVDSLQQGMAFALKPYVTSSFYQHSLTATTDIMSSIIGGLFKLPLAKILDIWGRPQGFALSVFFLVIGLAMMAACNDVETYAAAQVFYWLGYNGMSYSLSVFIADTSALKNRALMFALINSPYIVTTWISGLLATAVLDGPGFRWGFGAFAIITPVVTLPLVGLFWYNLSKARTAGLVPVRESGRSWLQSVRHYAVEFDLLGLVLVSGGLALFLLPFSIYSYQADEWRAPIIICFLVFGGLLLAAFAVWEKYLAPKTFIPYALLTDRTVLGACILSATLFVEFYIWDSYLSSFLQVVSNLTLTQATYVGNIYSVGSCFWSLVVGVLVRTTGRFKWLALYFGVPLTVLGVGLMIAFRQPDSSVGQIVACQILIAIGGGTLVICEQMAVMAATSHQYIAVVLAVEAMFASVGGAIGSTIASAIWTGVFPVRLAEYLPPESQANLTAIYEDLTVQLSYPVGSPTRDAINRAYGDAQKMMLIASTAVLLLAFVSTAVWRDIRVKDFKQTKGRVV